MKNKVSFDVKIDAETYKKLSYIASAEGRNINNQILHLTRTNIAYYERVHGKIKPAELDGIPLPDGDAEE
ncbi:MAG: hypothetical protein IJS45_03795 [Clostridia bacterium]|nr:hypothetical protein [Clostridia bacterium]